MAMPNENDAEEKKSFLSLKELPEQIRDFWAATGIPIVELMLAVVVLSWLVGPPALHHASESVTRWGAQSTHSAADHSSDTAPTTAANAESAGPGNEPKSDLEKYGISAILPLAALVVLLGLAQGLSAFLRMLGGTLPLHVAYRLDVLLTRYLPLDVLVRAWTYSSTANNLTTLSDRMDQEVERSSGTKADGFFRHSRELRPTAKALDSSRQFVAGLILAGCLVWLVSIVNLGVIAKDDPYKRIAVFLIVGVVVLIYLNLSFLRATRLYHYRKFADYVAWKNVELKASPLQSDELTLALNRIEEGLRDLSENFGRLTTFVRTNTDIEFDILAGKKEAQESLTQRRQHVEDYRQSVSR
jgi:hypothetical protein